MTGTTSTSTHFPLVPCFSLDFLCIVLSSYFFVYVFFVPYCAVTPTMCAAPHLLWHNEIPTEPGCKAGS